MKKYYSIKQASEYLPFSESLIRREIGKSLLEGIHFFKKFGKIVLEREALDDWMEGKDGEYNRKQGYSLDEHLSQFQEVS